MRTRGFVRHVPVQEARSIEVRETIRYDAQDKEWVACVEDVSIRHKDLSRVEAIARDYREAEAAVILAQDRD